jgi:hypothetical protein
MCHYTSFHLYQHGTNTIYKSMAEDAETIVCSCCSADGGLITITDGSARHEQHPHAIGPIIFDAERFVVDSLRYPSCSLFRLYALYFFLFLSRSLLRCFCSPLCGLQHELSF